jgi:hypothetical protein
MRSFRLSKSRITAGLQCGKRLWLSVHRPELEIYGADVERRFAAGDGVGLIARRLYGPGVLIDGGRNLSQSLRDTGTALARAGDLTLFEAAFRHRDVLVRSDVLQRRGGACHMVEVKSATRVKEHHLQDIAIQAWVAEGAGVPLDRLSIAVVDTGFVYPGGGDYRGLLREIPVADQARPLMARTPGWVRSLNLLLAGPLPAIARGVQCRRPFDCPFDAFCRAQDGAALIPADELGSALAESPCRHSDPARGVVEADATTFLAALPYPRAYLDFETVQFAVPPWTGTSPYQQLVFQWSCHIEERPGELRHEEFLDVSGAAPMCAAATTLLAATGTEGPVFVYGDFEKWRLVEMARMYPDLAPALERLTGRLVDLLRLTREHYHHPDLDGSYSLKAVLPTIAPELDHALLEEVNDGLSAQAAYHAAAMAATGEERRRELRTRMLAYCARDTEALVRVTRRLAGA